LIVSLCHFTVPGETLPTAAAYFDLGSKQFNNHQFTDAKASFARAVEMNAKYAEAYRALGMTDLELKDYQGAYHDWLKAVDLNPSDEKSKYYLGRLFYEADLPNEGAAWLREALKLAPNDYAAKTYLGLCAEALGFDDTAEHLYRRAIAESKDQQKPFAWAFLSLGDFLKKHGDPNGAVAVLEEGSHQCPEAHELSALGELLALRNQPERAEQVLRQAIAMDPALSQPHYRLGLLLRSLGRPEEARSEMTKFQEAKNQEDKAPKIMALRK
jgi:tetratricopeptide (TPR) repeat protein